MAVTQGPPGNSIIVRPLDPPLVRTLGLVQRRNKGDDPALSVVRNEIMTLANITEPAEPIPLGAAASTAPTGERA